MKNTKSKRKTALYGALVALAFIFSYLESLLPSVGIPGVKLGLANTVVLTALYLLHPLDALIISFVRILLAGFTFGSPAALIYSFCGGAVSLAVMIVCKKTDKFSVIGVSMAGGVSHNLGQLAAAAVVTGTAQIAWYLPVLLGAGLLTGALIGGVVRAVLPPLKRFLN